MSFDLLEGYRGNVDVNVSKTSSVSLACRLTAGNTSDILVYTYIYIYIYACVFAGGLG